MKFLFDFFPVLLFFVAYKLYGIYTATAVAIAASFIQVGVYWFKHKKFENSHLITLVILVLFGGATIVLQNEMFIKWKPSVVNWIFAVAFLGSQFIGNKTIIERMMGANITLPASIWLRLNMSWVVFFIALGIINLFVVYNFDTDTWVNFKLFGMMGLTILFIVAQAIYMSRHVQPAEIEKK
ncbi:MAG: septation protein A [Gammaproteobacteria bacterium]|jgi:intracellular septation protein